MQEERASHSVDGKPMDMEELVGSGNDHPDLDPSKESNKASESAGGDSDFVVNQEGESLQEEKPSDQQLFTSLEQLPVIPTENRSKNDKLKKRKTGKQSEKPARTEKLRDNLPKKMFIDEPNSKCRREYKNYDEMLACLNLLKYMDWDKIDPKTHKNSPCSLL